MVTTPRARKRPGRAGGAAFAGDGRGPSAVRFRAPQGAFSPLRKRPLRSPHNICYRLVPTERRPPVPGDALWSSIGGALWFRAQWVFGEGIEIMGDLGELIPYFTGINTWIALAGAALFVFLVLFRTTATEFAVNMNVPRRQAAGIVHMFMLLIAIVTLITLVLAFLDARDARATEARQAAQDRYQQLLADRQVALDQCVEAGIQSANFTQDFRSQEQSVRCPSGGCFGRSGSCNKREGTVSFTAPGDYFIENYEIVRGSMNHEKVTGLEVYQRDAEGRATAVRAQIGCDPGDGIGASGGWANASIQGLLRLRDESAARQGVLSGCEGQYPLPVPPT